MDVSIMIKYNHFKNKKIINYNFFNQARLDSNIMIKSL